MKYRNGERVQWATNDYWERGFDISDPAPGKTKKLVIEFYHPEKKRWVKEECDEWNSIELPQGGIIQE